MLAVVAAFGVAHAEPVGWRNDVGLSFGLFSGIGVRFARRFPEGVRVGIGAGFLHVPPPEPGVLGSHGASVGTEAAIDLTHGRTLRLLGIGGLGWTVATEFDPDQDGIPDDFEVLALGAGIGLEVLYWRNLSMTLHLMLGLDLLSARAVTVPFELTLSYGL